MMKLGQFNFNPEVKLTNVCYGIDCDEDHCRCNKNLNQMDRLIGVTFTDGTRKELEKLLPTLNDAQATDLVNRIKKFYHKNLTREHQILNLGDLDHILEKINK